MKPEEFTELKRLVQYDAASRGAKVTRELSDCRGKHRFESFAAAARTLRRKDLRHEAQPFHCRVCGGYHIGSVIMTRQKRLMQRERFRDEEEFV